MVVGLFPTSFDHHLLANRDLWQGQIAMNRQLFLRHGTPLSDMNYLLSTIDYYLQSQCTMNCPKYQISIANICNLDQASNQLRQAYAHELLRFRTDDSFRMYRSEIFAAATSQEKKYAVSQLVLQRLGSPAPLSGAALLSHWKPETAWSK